MSADIRVQATLIISQEALMEAVMAVRAQEAEEPAAIPAATSAMDPAAQTKRKRGRPKKVQAEAAVAPPEEKDIHLKIDFQQPMEIQFKTAIIQAAAQAHGDAVARRIFQSWTDADTAGVKFAMSLFSVATLQSVAKATADTPEAELAKVPRLFVTGLFQRGSELAEVAQPVLAPSGPQPCGICEQIGSHAPSCPNGLGRRAAPETPGGAIPSRVPNAAPRPVERQPEVCAVGGVAGGCPLPHGVVLQGGAHIAVHTPETLDAMRAATTGPGAPRPQFELPQPPPAKKGPGRPKKTKTE